MLNSVLSEKINSERNKKPYPPPPFASSMVGPLAQFISMSQDGLSDVYKGPTI